MSPIGAVRAHLRLGALAAGVVSLAATSALAGEPPRPQPAQARPADPPRHGDRGGGLLLLSFLVPLPVPMAFVAPAASRPPPATGSRESPGRTQGPPQGAPAKPARR